MAVQTSTPRPAPVAPPPPPAPRARLWPLYGTVAPDNLETLPPEQTVQADVTIAPGNSIVVVDPGGIPIYTSWQHAAHSPMLPAYDTSSGTLNNT